MPAGHNGPYRDPETPVRNTSHWLVIFLQAAELTGENRYREGARRAIEYLLSPAARPHGATFVHRENPDKDRCNGLIGQAWTIEALAVASQRLDRPDLCRLATDVFCSHPFDERLGIWKRVEVDGTVLPYDRTFNHQLWFAAAGGLLAQAGSDEADARVAIFLDRLESLLDVEDTGLVRHPLRPDLVTDRGVILSRPLRYRGLLRTHLLHYARPPSRKRALRTKAIGYHSFNLYALALLKRCYPSHSVWDTTSVRRALEYARSEAYRESIDDNRFGYPYNPPGFEIPFAFETFDVATREDRETWVRTQIQRCFDPTMDLMSANTPDPETHAARLYEATRLEAYQVGSESDPSKQ